MSAPHILTHKSPMREAFDRIAAKFEAETIPLTRSDVVHLITLARAQVDANEPMTCGHAKTYAFVQIPGSTLCLICEHEHAHESLAIRAANHCRIVSGIFGRFFLAHADRDDLGWSGSRWVPCTARGIPTGRSQVCNFATEAEASTYCLSCGLVPEDRP